MLRSAARNRTWKSSISCLEVLARLLAHPHQAPSLYMVHLTHQIRLLLGMQNSLNVTQYQTVCGCYNQLVEQQQNPQPSFSSAEVLKSLAQVRSRLFVEEESISAPVVKKRSVSFTPRRSGWCCKVSVPIFILFFAGIPA